MKKTLILVSAVSGRAVTQKKGRCTKTRGAVLPPHQSLNTNAALNGAGHSAPPASSNVDERRAA